MATTNELGFEHGPSNLAENTASDLGNLISGAVTGALAGVIILSLFFMSQTILFLIALASIPIGLIAFKYYEHPEWFDYKLFFTAFGAVLALLLYATIGLIL